MQKRNLKKFVFLAAAGHLTISYFHSATDGSASGGKKSAFCILNSTFPSAFSLIELIVVMLIIGVLTTVAIMKFTGVDSQSNRIAANELRAHLSYVRNTAMSRERAMKVVFDVASNRYDVYAAVSNLSGDYLPAEDPVTRQAWSVDLNSKFRGVALSSVNINGGNTLYFSETNGMPFDAVFAQLSTTGAITFSSGLKVAVAPVTGYANLE